MNTCIATRANGQPCTAKARPGRQLCFAHDPELQDKRAAARLNGGKNKATSKRLDKLTPASLRPVLEKLFLALNGLEDGSLEPRVATAMASVAGVIVRVYEASDLETRLRALEAGQEKLVSNGY